MTRHFGQSPEFTPFVFSRILPSQEVRIHQHPNPPVRFLRGFFISLGVTLDVVGRHEADENQLLPTERTDEQTANEVEMLVTAATDALP